MGNDKENPYQKKLDYLYKRLTEEDVKRKENRRIINEAKLHLRLYISLMLKTRGKYKSTPIKVFAAIVIRTLYDMDKEELIHLKEIGGQTRVYKNFYCPIDRNAWKKCPEWKCSVKYEDDDWASCKYTPDYAKETKDDNEKQQN
jgi:hypothetical protein